MIILGEENYSMYLWTTPCNLPPFYFFSVLHVAHCRDKVGNTDITTGSLLPLMHGTYN